MANRELHFLNPEFERGPNLTIRRGDKWADVEQGQVLDLWADSAPGVADRKVTEAIVIRAAQFTSIDDIPERWLQFQHGGPGTLDELRDVLLEAYGDFRGEVTCLFFWVN